MPSVESLRELARAGNERYHEFLRVPSMSAGVYVLAPGNVDSQSPHSEDEIYLVVRGRGRFHLDGTERSVGPGDILFVPAHGLHRFHDVEEELVLLVVFAPAERAPAAYPWMQLPSRDYRGRSRRGSGGRPRRGRVARTRRFFSGGP